MTLPVFYVPSDALLAAPTVVVDGAEGRHGAVVRRLRAGEKVRLTDGRGNVADATVAAVHGHSFTVEVSHREVVAKPQPRIIVVQALPKGEHADLAVSLLTQVGVDEVIPWSAERCVVRWSGDRTERGVTKWRTTAHESAKQSRRVWWPTVSDPMKTTEVCEFVSSAALAVVLHETAEHRLADIGPPESGDVVVIVGPEGGISDGELEQFATVGATQSQVGPTVMRTRVLAQSRQRSCCRGHRAGRRDVSGCVG